MSMTAPSNEPEHNDLDDARSDLREGIANSRALVRQSRVLIELSESGSALPADDDLGPIAN